MPINLDPADKKNEAYRNVLSQIATSHGGFTHYQTPTGNHLEVLGHSPEELEFSKNTLANYLKQHHGVEGDFRMPPARGYLQFNDEMNKTAAPSHKTADVRNVLHELSKGARANNPEVINYLKKSGIDLSKIS